MDIKARIDNLTGEQAKSVLWNVLQTADTLTEITKILGAIDKEMDDGHKIED